MIWSCDVDGDRPGEVSQVESKEHKGPEKGLKYRSEGKASVQVIVEKKGDGMQDQGSNSLSAVTGPRSPS